MSRPPLPSIHPSSWGLTRRLAVYLRPYRWWMLLAFGLVIGLALFVNALPLLVQRAIDSFLIVSGASLSATERMDGIVRYGLLFLAFSSLAYVLRFGQTYLMSWVGQHIIFDIRQDIFDKMTRLPLAYFDRTPVGRLLTRITSDVESMQRLVTDGFVGLTADLMMLLVTAGYMLYLNPRLACAMFLMLPILFAGLTFLNIKLRQAHRDVRGHQSELNAALQESLSGMSTIRLFGQEHRRIVHFEERNNDLRHAFRLSVRWFSFYFPTLDMLRALSMTLVLLVGGSSLLKGETAISIGILVAFLDYIRVFFRPLEDLSDKSSIFQEAMASSERIFDLLDTDLEVQDPTHPVELDEFTGQVDFDSVWFAYNGEDWVLKDVSFSIEPGDSIAIVGATGAGKTSIISLLARFYDVQKGDVRIEGHDVRDLRQEDLRKHIGIVLQDPTIFNGTIADNIRFLDTEITDDQVMAAARHVNAHAFISELAAGYQTRIGEEGIGLSTGQKQLLALARALVHNPEILFILDEATASVDSETEQLIQDALAKVMHERTCILIAHRLSTIRHVDRILVMREGEIVESGSHTELLGRNGYYHRLYELLSRGADVS